MKKLLYIAMCAALLCGCEYSFDLDDTDENDKLHVLCVAGEGNETFINIQKAIPANRDNTNIPVTTDVKKLDLKVNGKSVSFSKYDINSSRYNLWRTEDPILPGDRLSLEVEVEGTDPVMAETTVPELPVIKSFNYSAAEKSDYSYKTIFDVEIDNVDEESYLAFSCNSMHIHVVENEEGVETERDTTYSRVWVEPAVEYNDITDDTEEPWISTYFNGISLDTYDGDELNVLDARTVLSNKGHIQFSIRPNRDDVRVVNEEWYFNPETFEYKPVAVPEYTIYSYYSYSIAIRRISKEAYCYIKARHIENVNVLATIGLAPPTFTYSNIDGGFGVLAGMSKSETPYFKVKFSD